MMGGRSEGLETGHDVGENGECPRVGIHGCV